MNEQNLHVLLCRIVLATTSLGMGAVGCGGTAEDTADGDTTASGGTTSSGGAESGGTGGVVGAGGSATGGLVGTGGEVSTGGVVGTGGAIGTGGVVGTGGAIGTGGVVGTGGAGGNCAGPTPPLCGGHLVTVDRGCVTLPAPTLPECEVICGPGDILAQYCSVPTDQGGAQLTVQCGMTCAVGRRPAGLVPCDIRSNDVGDFFARVAYLEAASVRAFRDLRGELHARKAPRSLLRALSRAARDEVRHARATSALARRFGGHAKKPVTNPQAPRSLEQLAIENVTEGCVRETYGALVAHFQAAAARDAGVRAELRRIARDETRHASLSWRVQRWLEARLDPAARARVQAARQAAAAELRIELAATPPRDLIEKAGMPPAKLALRLVDELTAALWAA